MGLSVKSLSKIKFLSKEQIDKDRVWFLHNNEDCSINMRNEGSYSYEESKNSDNYSYSYYNRMRDKLCRTINKIPASDVWHGNYSALPFYELINFSDCEGAFDTDICKKLYKDFHDHQTEIDRSLNEDFKLFYIDLMRLFEFAAKNEGAVVFC